MDELIKTILENHTREEAIVEIEKAIDFINYKLYTFSEQYLVNEAYLDTYTMYAQTASAYMSILTLLKASGGN